MDPLLILVLRLHFILIHGPDSQWIELNINEISSLREVREGEEAFGPNTKCVIFMTNGKHIGTLETCNEVHKEIDQVEREGE